MSIKTLENKVVKTINNLITVKELVDKNKGEMKKNDLSKSRKNILESKLLKQENNLSSLLETQIKINHTDTNENNPFDFSVIKFNKIVKTINNIITVEDLIDKNKGELKKR